MAGGTPAMTYAWARADVASQSKFGDTQVGTPHFREFLAYSQVQGIT